MLLEKLLTEALLRMTGYDKVIGEEVRLSELANSRGMHFHPSHDEQVETKQHDIPKKRKREGGG